MNLNPLGLLRPYLAEIKIGLMIAAVVALFGFGFYVKYVWDDRIAAKEKVKTLELELDAANSAVADLAKLNTKQAERLRAAKTTERKIRDVPKDQDGAVAPVLADSLERLR